MPEKKVYELIIDPEFRDLIPPLNEEELKLLEASMRTVWKHYCRSIRTSSCT